MLSICQSALKTELFTIVSIISLSLCWTSSCCHRCWCPAHQGYLMGSPEYEYSSIHPRTSSDRNRYIHGHEQWSRPSFLELRLDHWRPWPKSCTLVMSLPSTCNIQSLGNHERCRTSTSIINYNLSTHPWALASSTRNCQLDDPGE